MKKIDHKSRVHALLSASSAHRWLNCPPSAVAAEAYPAQDTAYTQEGTQAHEVAEVAARLRLNPSDGRRAADLYLPAEENGITQEMIDCAEGYADYIQEQIRSEDAIVLLEQRVDFSPWVPGGFGTADCIILQGSTMDVIDYKYGQGVAVSAEGNEQEMLYGLGALNDYGIAFDVELVRLHIYQPRMNNTSVFEVKADDLQRWGENIVKPLAAQAAKGEGDYFAGAHCKFCPHAGLCPKLTETCTKIVETHDLRVAVPVLAPHQVAEVLQLEPLIGLWLKRVKAQALTTLLDGGEVPGYKVVAGRASRSWADDLEAKDVLLRSGYTFEEITETKLLTPAAMEKALGKKKVAELLDGHILTTPGAPTITTESDKRPVYDRLAEAVKDFK